MKVLDEGKKLPWSIEERCSGAKLGGGGCNSLLLVEEEDIDRHPYGNWGWYYSFYCPVCGVETAVDEEKIPERIRKNINWRIKQPNQNKR